MKNRTRIILVIIWQLCFTGIYANQKDSLLTSLSFTSVPAEHLSILTQLYEISYRDNSYEAEKYLLSALGISIQTNNYSSQVTVYKNLSKIYEQSDISRAYIFILEAKRIAEEQRFIKELPELNYLVAAVLYKQEKFSEALSMMKDASQLAMSGKDTLLAAKADLYHTFSLYFAGEQQHATILLKKTEDSVVRTGDHSFLSFFYFHLQDFYKTIHKNKLALEMNDKAYTLFLAENDDYNALLCMKDKAAVYTELNDYQKATDIYERILTELNTTQQYTILQPVIMDSLSSFYARRNNPGFSRYYQKKSQLLTESMAASSRSLRFKTTATDNTATLTSRFSLWEKFIIGWLSIMSIVSAVVYVRYKKIQASIQKEKETVERNVRQLVEKEKKLAQEMTSRIQEQKKDLAMRQASEKAVHEAREIVEKAKEETRQLQAEVTTKSVLLANKNDYLLQLQEKLKSTDTSDLKRLAKEIRSNIGDTDHWANYLQNFNLLHSQFLDRLTKKHPDLTVHEIKLVCFILTGLSTKEIAGIFSVEPESIKKARYRLKKKLTLKEEDNLNLYLRSM
jgi:DNA-binding CsgD family transcriptional regulator